MISIIIPAYNAEKYIKETLDSIIAQDYKDFEIILVDDGSTDNTASIMQDYQSGKQSNENDIKIIIMHTSHNGVASARNIGMSVATGQYFMFFDADDIMEPCCLDEMVGCIEYEDVDMVIGQSSKIDENGDHLSLPPAISSLPWEGRYNTDNIISLRDIGDYADTVTGTKLYKSSIILNNRLTFDNVKIADDVAFFLKYIYFCGSIYVLNDKVVKYRVVSGSLTHNASNDDLDVIKSFKNIEKYLASIPGIKDDSFNYLLQNMKIKDYYAWSLHYISPSASSRTLRKRLFKKFHREILKDGKKYKKYLSTERLTELEEAEKRYRLSFLYLSSIYIAFKRKTKRKESEYI